MARVAPEKRSHLPPANGVFKGANQKLKGGLMKTALIGVIKHQSEIYIVAENNGYVSLTTDPDHEDQQCVRVHVSNIDAVVSLLSEAKREVLEAKD